MDKGPEREFGGLEKLAYNDIRYPGADARNQATYEGVRYPGGRPYTPPPQPQQEDASYAGPSLARIPEPLPAAWGKQIKHTTMFQPGYTDRQGDNVPGSKPPVVEPMPGTYHDPDRPTPANNLSSRWSRSNEVVYNPLSLYPSGAARKGKPMGAAPSNMWVDHGDKAGPRLSQWDPSPSSVADLRNDVRKENSYNMWEIDKRDVVRNQQADLAQYNKAKERYDRSQAYQKADVWENARSDQANRDRVNEEFYSDRGGKPVAAARDQAYYDEYRKSRNREQNGTDVGNTLTAPVDPSSPYYARNQRIKAETARLGQQQRSREAGTRAPVDTAKWGEAQAMPGGGAIRFKNPGYTPPTKPPTSKDMGKTAATAMGPGAENARRKALYMSNTGDYAGMPRPSEPWRDYTGAKAVPDKARPSAYVPPRSSGQEGTGTTVPAGKASAQPARPASAPSAQAYDDSKVVVPVKTVAAAPGTVPPPVRPYPGDMHSDKLLDGGVSVLAWKGAKDIWGGLRGGKTRIGPWIPDTSTSGAPGKAVGGEMYTGKRGILGSLFDMTQRMGQNNRLGLGASPEGVHMSATTAPTPAAKAVPTTATVTHGSGDPVTFNMEGGKPRPSTTVTTSLSGGAHGPRVWPAPAKAANTASRIAGRAFGPATVLADLAAQGDYSYLRDAYTGAARSPLEGAVKALNMDDGQVISQWAGHPAARHHFGDGRGGMDLDSLSKYVRENPRMSRKLLAQEMTGKGKGWDEMLEDYVDKTGPEDMRRDLALRYGAGPNQNIIWKNPETLAGARLNNGSTRDRAVLNAMREANSARYQDPLKLPQTTYGNYGRALYDYYANLGSQVARGNVDNEGAMAALGAVPLPSGQVLANSANMLTSDPGRGWAGNWWEGVKDFYGNGGLHPGVGPGDQYTGRR